MKYFNTRVRSEGNQMIYPEGYHEKIAKVSKDMFYYEGSDGNLYRVDALNDDDCMFDPHLMTDVEVLDEKV